MRKLFLILLNPWALAIPFTILVVLFLPPVIKYKAAIVSNEFLPGTCFFFSDLDGDGITEKVGVTINSLGNSSLKLYDIKGGLIEQVNFRRGLTSFPPNVSFGDFDHDGFQEIFLFTLSGDSIFIAFSELLGPEKFTTYERFIDRIEIVNDTIDFSVSSGSHLLKDMNRDGYNDLVFTVSARYSIAPRQVYIYDINKDTIWRSGSFGSNLQELKVADINGDGFFEVMGDNLTRGNTRDSMNLKFGDSSAWLMVYDHELRFLFEPVEFPSYGAKLDVQPFITEDSGFIAVLYRDLGVNGDSSAVILYSTQGKLLRQKTFDPGDRYLLSTLITSDPGNYRNLYVIYKDGRLIQLNSDLETTATHDVREIVGGTPFYADLDNDRHDEIIFLNRTKNALVITRNDFSRPVELMSDIRLDAPRFSLKTDPDHAVQLAIQSGDNLYLVDYWFNRLYWLRFGLYLLIYAGFLLFILLIRKLHQIQIERRRAAEKELTELQLLTIKNQVDPHFTFNALNAINSLILKEKKEDAYRFASKLSHLMRTALENSDRINTSLKEELDFIRSYLDLQKIRFRDSFEYQISVDEQVDEAIPVPRHILQTYVENAVKHGLRPLERGGLLTIAVARKEGHLLFIVRDNGVGRAAASVSAPESTGKGLGIMQQIFAIYERLYRVVIEQEIVDLKDEAGRPAGTEVRIKVPGPSLSEGYINGMQRIR
jgi:hypothetical protein